MEGNGKASREPWDVLWMVRTEQLALKRAAEKLSEAKAEVARRELTLGKLETELLPLLPEHGDLRRWDLGDGEWVEATRDGNVVSTELLVADTIPISWPEPQPDTDPELTRRLDDLASVTDTPARVPADAVVLTEDDGEIEDAAMATVHAGGPVS